ncbi:MAG: hypothetical protein GAK28_00370 [Luteibacter sp.]|uniref:GNAT family N-acetyltransferase n=1 Tax=Luteibacter sp. TaxID=1886636 RepID=UPI0013824F10|nr:GNAT family N-acetyltransferase [Luteibacter sp.]KAF1009726.1 MAG: hypothetical protein GAK28_00370 [Luteibacter sp.]
MPTLRPFPIRKTLYEDIGGTGFHLRAAGTDDLPFLRQLYAHSRAEEMKGVPWPEAAKHRFLDSQFELQHTHYLSHYPDADFFILERDGHPMGRLYVDDRDGNLHVIDISLLVSMQGKGIGTDVLASLQATAVSRGFGVTLHVSRFNPRAQALYERLGFMVTGTSDTHTAMRWIS